MDKLVTLRLIERLKNSNFILESKVVELNKMKIQNNQILCENYIICWK